MVHAIYDYICTFLKCFPGVFLCVLKDPGVVFDADVKFGFLFHTKTTSNYFYLAAGLCSVFMLRHLTG